MFPASELALPFLLAICAGAFALSGKNRAPLAFSAFFLALLIFSPGQVSTYLGNSLLHPIGFYDLSNPLERENWIVANASSLAPDGAFLFVENCLFPRILSGTLERRAPSDAITLDICSKSSGGDGVYVSIFVDGVATRKLLSPDICEEVTIRTANKSKSKEIRIYPRKYGECDNEAILVRRIQFGELPFSKIRPNSGNLSKEHAGFAFSLNFVNGTFRKYPIDPEFAPYLKDGLLKLNTGFDCNHTSAIEREFFAPLDANSLEIDACFGPSSIDKPAFLIAIDGGALQDVWMEDGCGTLTRPLPESSDGMHSIRIESVSGNGTCGYEETGLAMFRTANTRGFLPPEEAS